MASIKTLYTNASKTEQLLPRTTADAVKYDNSNSVKTVLDDLLNPVTYEPQSFTYNGVKFTFKRIGNLVSLVTNFVLTSNMAVSWVTLGTLNDYFEPLLDGEDTFIHVHANNGTVIKIRIVDVTRELRVIALATINSGVYVEDSAIYIAK